MIQFTTDCQCFRLLITPGGIFVTSNLIEPDHPLFSSNKYWYLSCCLWILFGLSLCFSLLVLRMCDGFFSKNQFLQMVESWHAKLNVLYRGRLWPSNFNLNLRSKFRKYRRFGNHLICLLYSFINFERLKSLVKSL